MCRFIKDVFTVGTFNDNLNKTLLVLIPKNDKPESLSQMRPINLCNVSYKIITKIISNRLKPSFRLERR